MIGRVADVGIRFQFECIRHVRIDWKACRNLLWIRMLPLELNMVSKPTWKPKQADPIKSTVSPLLLYLSISDGLAPAKREFSVASTSPRSIAAKSGDTVVRCTYCDTSILCCRARAGACIQMWTSLGEWCVGQVSCRIACCVLSCQCVRNAGHLVLVNLLLYLAILSILFFFSNKPEVRSPKTGSTRLWLPPASAPRAAYPSSRCLLMKLFWARRQRVLWPHSHLQLQTQLARRSPFLRCIDISMSTASLESVHQASPQTKTKK